MSRKKYTKKNFILHDLPFNLFDSRPNFVSPVSFDSWLEIVPIYVNTYIKNYLTIIVRDYDFNK
jgi:hypothetical protein